VMANSLGGLPVEVTLVLVVVLGMLLLAEI
jgi:hypothetical protein